MLTGCETEQVYKSGITGTVITTEMYDALPSEERQQYKEITVEVLAPDIKEKITAGATAAQIVLQVVQPVIPEPYASLAGLVLGGLVAAWQTIRKAKIQDRLSYVELGSIITKDSVNKVIRPSAELWGPFKQSQIDGAENTRAIMPDKLKENIAA